MRRGAAFCLSWEASGRRCSASNWAKLALLARSIRSRGWIASVALTGGISARRGTTVRVRIHRLRLQIAIAVFVVTASEVEPDEAAPKPSKSKKRHRRAHDTQQQSSHDQKPVRTRAPRATCTQPWSSGTHFSHQGRIPRRLAPQTHDTGPLLSREVRQNTSPLLDASPLLLHST